MGNAIAKCLGGSTDYNGNGVPDNKDVQKLIEQFLAKQKEKKDKKLMKQILKAK